MDTSPDSSASAQPEDRLKVILPYMVYGLYCVCAVCIVYTCQTLFGMAQGTPADGSMPLLGAEHHVRLSKRHGRKAQKAMEAAAAVQGEHGAWSSEGLRGHF